MSFDIPLHIPDDSPEAQIIEAIVLREQITPAEAVLVAIRGGTTAGLVSTPAPAEEVEPLTEAELEEFHRLFPSSGLFDDVTDEQWDRIVAAARAMNEEVPPTRV